MAVREGRFLLNRTDALVEGTVRGAISHVVQAFRESGRQNPTKDADNMLSVLLSRQFRACRNNDPKEVQQKALPFIVLEDLAKRRVSELDRGISQLTICAGFFACCSCEYFKVP
jgi:ABC-type Mn2+/Zn2+ transport system ATPase subunit